MNEKSRDNLIKIYDQLCLLIINEISFWLEIR
jgi:hypothetical protein